MPWPSARCRQQLRFNDGGGHKWLPPNVGGGHKWPVRHVVSMNALRNQLSKLKHMLAQAGQSLTRALLEIS
jgi:hypothetical protein